MRLSPQELDSIRSLVSGLDPKGRVYLFGSRTDDAKRGGDIDLYVETSRRLDLKTKLLLQYRISSACDTGVDMVFKSPEDEETPIHQIAKKGIRL